MMELLLTSEYYIIKHGNHTLWCDRYSGSAKLIPMDDINKLTLQGKFVCIGFIYGCIGKIRFFPDGDWYLIVITKRTKVSCYSYRDIVYKIDKISLLPLSSKITYDSFDFDMPPNVKRSDIHSFIKDYIVENASQSVLAHPKSQKFSPNFQIKNSVNSDTEEKYSRKELFRRDRLESRLLDALLRMFNDSGNFFYSSTYDLTNSLQRNYSLKSERNKSVLDKFDDRFFWNKCLLNDLYEYSENLYTPWILAVIQGFYETKSCCLDFKSLPSLLTKDIITTPSEDATRKFDSNSEFIFSDSLGSEISQDGFETIIQESQARPCIHFTLISRRSRHRAGTRYKRRGVDENRSVANFVETEIIILIGSQKFSYLLVRGSIPVFWSQSGHKYKPQPLLTQNFDVTHDAFKLHLLEQLSYYQQETFVNLVDEIGKESVVKDALESHLLQIDSLDINYVYFDFHKNCKDFQNRGLKELLINLNRQLQFYKFFWLSLGREKFDDILCKQQGVFRINCMDCLDRTNVVQAEISMQILELALMKLGLLMPDQSLPFDCIQAYRLLWANNGDAISRQYAGTAAMKGDLTRTGHRNIKGTLKDGIYSANRYYINTFKDSLRQTVIDLMQGIFHNLVYPDSITECLIDNAHVTNHLIEVLKIYLNLNNHEIKCWALKEAIGYKCISSEFLDDFCIFFLFNFGFLVLLVESSNDFISSFELVQFNAIEKVQFGVFNKFKLLDRKYGIRIYYTLNGNSGCHYTLCSLNSKIEEAKTELNQLYNELKISTSKLDIYPYFSTNKISNHKSFSHSLPYFPDECSSEENLSKLRDYITIFDLPDFFQKSVGSILKTNYFSSSTENLDSLTYEEIETEKDKMDCGTAIIPRSASTIRRSFSDTSIYSHSSNNDLIVLSNNSPLSNKDVFNYVIPRHRADTHIAQLSSLFT